MWVWVFFLVSLTKCAHFSQSLRESFCFVLFCLQSLHNNTISLFAYKYIRTHIWCMLKGSHQHKKPELQKECSELKTVWCFFCLKKEKKVVVVLAIVYFALLSHSCPSFSIIISTHTRRQRLTPPQFRSPSLALSHCVCMCTNETNWSVFAPCKYEGNCCALTFSRAGFFRRYFPLISQ